MILVRYGEIGLKGKLRKRFEGLLISNIKSVLQVHEFREEISADWGRIYIPSQDEKIARLVAGVFGVTSTSVAVETDSRMSSIRNKALEIGSELINRESSFAVRTRRAGEHDFSSMDVQRTVGAELQSQTGSRVDLSNPDVTIYIEVREDSTYVYTSIIKGFGGLPVGSQERVLSIINDRKSLASTWYALRRGCDADILSSPEMDDAYDILLPWADHRKIRVLEGHGGMREMLTNAFATRYPATYCSATMDQMEGLLPLLRDRGMPVLTPLLPFSEDEIKGKIAVIENYFNSIN
ncbi:MAG: THUMP domain-containing protein [Archaeoglobaceae archaeon]